MDRRTNFTWCKNVIGEQVTRVTCSVAHPTQSRTPKQSSSWLLVMAAAMISFSGACSSGSSGSEDRPKPVVLKTEYDDKRAGQNASEQVAAEMGILREPALTAYVRQVGMKLVRYAPLRSFDYTFSIVDQPMPNAFALPGGHIYVSRGMLALANSENELANVLGHEITHSAARHSAARQEMARRSSPLAMPYLRMAKMASHSREHEREADQGGQFLAASAGYDAMGMSTFLRKLGNSERMEVGYSRLQSYADTHPGSTERSAATANRAQSMRNPSLSQGDHRDPGYLKHINGLVLGTNPAEGIFKGNMFLHPDMNFHIRFPQGWQLVNSPQSVGAMAPKGEAIISLTAESSGDDSEQGAKDFLAKFSEKFEIKVEREHPTEINGIKAYQIDAFGRMQGKPAAASMTFIAYGGTIFRITTAAAPSTASQFLGRGRASARSFGPLTSEELNSIEVLRLRVVDAQAGESLTELGKRTRNAYAEQQTAVLNGIFTDYRFREGEKVKIARSEPYNRQGSARATLE